MIKKIWSKIKTAPDMSPRAQVLWTVGGLFLSSVCLTLLVLLVGTVKLRPGYLLYYFGEPFMVLLNYLPIALLMLLFYLLFNRGWIAFLLTAILSYGMAFVNYFKVLFRAEPFVVADLATVSEGANAGGEFAYEFPLLFWIGLGAIALGTILLGRYARGRLPKKVWWLRPLCMLLCLGFAQCMWSPHYSEWDSYGSYFWEDNKVFDDWILWERYSKRGVIYSFIYSATDVVVREPAGYDPEQVEAQLSKYETELIPKDKQINLQIHMLESFSDLSELGIQFQKDPYEAWHLLEQESYSGTLISDTQGGGTNNSERSVTTGFTFPQPTFGIPTNSYVWFFRDSGYDTLMTHPGDEWFYDRYAINRRLGFERGLYDQNYFKDFPGVYHGKDKDYFPLLRELYLENVGQGKPSFGYHVTYQNHSPYESQILLGEEYLSPQGLSEETRILVNNYLQGVRETGDAVSQYVDLYRQDEAPVVLVFFGDHKATLGESNSAYEELGIPLGDGTEDSCYNLYSTPYLIWANDAAKELMAQEPVGEGPIISPCYLMNEIFNLCGWKGNVWLQYQEEIRQELPVLHRGRTCLVDGVLTQELPEEINALRLRRNRVEFYWRYNFME